MRLKRPDRLERLADPRRESRDTPESTVRRDVWAFFRLLTQPVTTSVSLVPPRECRAHRSTLVAVRGSWSGFNPAPQYLRNLKIASLVRLAYLAACAGGHSSERQNDQEIVYPLPFHAPVFVRQTPWQRTPTAFSMRVLDIRNKNINRPKMG